MKDLGTPNVGLACSTSYGINAKRQVVGDSGVCGMGGTGWLWEEGSIVDLNTLVSPDTTVHVAGAASINERGEIVAGGMTGDGNQHVVVLIPCDENHPGVDGCDYSMVEATSGSVLSTPEQVLPTPLWRRNNSFDFPRTVIPQTN